MAMLMINRIFERTWKNRAGAPPEIEYWIHVIGSVKPLYPDFVFLAECYWDLEWEVLQQGFHFCYDKRLYDRLAHGDAESIGLHLYADRTYQQKLVRFLENHDERRAAAMFPGLKGRAAAVIAATLPGARLFHRGQLEGRKVRVPVFLRRLPGEVADENLFSFYVQLLKVVTTDVFRNGHWGLCERSGWPDNPSYRNIVAWNWVKDEKRYLIVVNWSGGTAQARVRVPWPEVRAESLRLIDLASGEVYERAGDELHQTGLYVELQPWQYHFFECVRGR
jgi:hypothetical protein